MWLFLLDGSRDRESTFLWQRPLLGFAGLQVRGIIVQAMAPTMLQHPTSTGTEESRSSPTALTTTTTTTTTNNNNNPFEAERRILLEQYVKKQTDR